LIKKDLNPKLPDVWLVDKYPKSLFIEVKRLREPFVEGQKEGLAIIKKYLGCDIRIARVCSEDESHQEITFGNLNITEIYQQV
jgi:hypothetical protein